MLSDPERASPRRHVARPGSPARLATATAIRQRPATRPPLPPSLVLALATLSGVSLLVLALVTSHQPVVGLALLALGIALGGIRRAPR